MLYRATIASCLSIFFTVGLLSKLAVDDQALLTRELEIPEESKFSKPREVLVVNIETASNLFGVHRPGKATAIVSKPIPKTNLKLSLQGTFVSSDESLSSAIISSKSFSKRFHVGDKVMTGVVLHSVTKNYVILLRNGVQEQLKFERITT